MTAMSPELPASLAGWTWQTNGITKQVRLVQPDDCWWTRDYRADRAEQAINEALRHLAAQQPAEEQPTVQAIDAAVRSGDTQALATIAAATLDGTVMMDESEARACVSRIQGHLEGARRELLDLEDREGWRALGYDSWRACVTAEFGQSQAYLYRQLTAAKIEREIDSPIGEIPESHLRPLSKLDTPDDRRAALDRANELAGDKPRTAAHVQQAVQEIKPPAAPVPFWQSLTSSHPTAHLWTRTGEYSYRAACGMTAQRAPAGSTEAGHCSSCVRAVWREEAAPARSLGINRPDGTPVQEPPLTLPPLPADLASLWTRWRSDDGAIGMRSVYGLKLSGTDAAALEQEARSLVRPLAELGSHDWRVFDDGRGGYTASHQHYEPIAALDVPRLALLAWRARMNEADLPDLPDDVIDGLYLAGHDPKELAGRGLPLGELRHLAGLGEVAAPPTAEPPLMPEDLYAAGYRYVSWSPDRAVIEGPGGWRGDAPTAEAVWAIGRGRLNVLQERAERAAQGPPLPIAPLARCPTCTAEILNGLWGDRNECGICYQARQRARRQTPTHPPAPKSADVSALLEYVRNLETYVIALEERLEQRSEYGPVPTLQEIER
jgi:hypothetical protein